MIAESAHSATESPSEVLSRLEVTLIWLWSTEPQCPVEQRQALLARLNDVSTRSDVLGLRHSVFPDASIDADELRACERALGDLSHCWLDPSELLLS